MILHLGPHAPVLARVAADFALALHIAGGTVGITGGAVAFAARKGGGPHRFAGLAFVGGMLTMSAIGTVTSVFLPQPTSTIAGVFTVYLVLTGWMTMRRAAAPTGVFEAALAFVGLAAAVGDLSLGLIAQTSAKGLIDGYPPQPEYVFAAVAALAAGLDLSLLRRQPLARAHRLARHLWRMGVALLIAAASLFLGQPQVFPAPLRHGPFLALPVLAVLALTLFWLARVLIQGRSGRRRGPPVPFLTSPLSGGRA
jgi:hypothetical protein